MIASRRYAVGFLAVVAATAIGAAVINARVDPWRVTPTRWADDSLDPYRDISARLRTGKAGMVRAAPALGAAIFGSSRAANALDPSDPRWGRDDVLNLACPAGFLYESVAMARYAMHRHPLEIAVLAIDPGDLSSDLDTRPMGDFHASPLAGNTDPDRELRYWIGIAAVEASIQTLENARYGRLPPYDPRGLRVRSRKPPGKPQIAFIHEQIVGEAEFGLLSEGRGGEEVDPAKARLLEEFLIEARSRRVRVLLYLHPTHALRHLRAADVSDPPALFAGERRALAEIAARANRVPGGGPAVEVWDFLDAHPVNGDPLPGEDGMMRHWTDLDHYTVEVGGAILARMMDWPVGMAGADDCGERLAPDLLDERLERVRAGYRDYLAGAGATDIARKEAWIERPGAPR